MERKNESSKRFYKNQFLMRKIKGDIKLPPSNTTGEWKIIKEGKPAGKKILSIKKVESNRPRHIYARYRGLKICHIGEDIWKIGRSKEVKGKGLHQVIYGPDKEYHLWGKDVIDSLKGDYDELHPEWAGEYFNRQGNQVDESKLKIYILTHILDDVNNWCFDLTIIPSVGKLKVVYNNGSVKNINFTGIFEKIKKPKYKEYTDCDSDWTFINPIGYRKW